MNIIDSHQHFWKVGAFDYPWMSSEVRTLYQDYLPPMLARILRENSVAETMLVQASDSLDETRWMLNLAEQNSFIGGVVGWVDLKSADIEQQLREFAASPKFKGVRHLVESERDDAWLEQAEVVRGIQRLGDYGVSYDLLVHTKHLPSARLLVERCPETSFVIDHMAKPPIANGDMRNWRMGLKAISSFPNLVCKLSGLVTEANWSGWTLEDLRPAVETALEFFGPKRLMFGSDWPVCLLAASYERVLEVFQTLTRNLSDNERRLIFHDNAAAFYRL